MKHLQVNAVVLGTTVTQDQLQQHFGTGFHTPGRTPAKHLVFFDKSYLVSVSTSAVWLTSFRET